MKRRILSFILLIVLLQSSVLMVQSSSWEIDATTVVSRVVDGDTFDTTSEGRIRLADVDTPESGEGGYYEAKNFLISLVDGKTVYLDIDDVHGTGPYGRLICVVYVEHNSTHYTNVNEALLVESVAVIKNYDNEFNPYAWSLRVPIETIPEPTQDIAPLFVALMVIILLLLMIGIIIKTRWGTV